MAHVSNQGGRLTTDVDKLRQQLKELYKQRLAVNFRLRDLKFKAKRKGIRSLKTREIEVPKGPNTELSVVQAAMVLGVSRDKLYRLLRSKKLDDLHPLTIGRFIRPTYINDLEPKAYEKSYEEWKSKWARHAEQVSLHKEKEAIKAMRNAQHG